MRTVLNEALRINTARQCRASASLICPSKRNATDAKGLEGVRGVEAGGEGGPLHSEGEEVALAGVLSDGPLGQSTTEAAPGLSEPDLSPLMVSFSVAVLQKPPHREAACVAHAYTHTWNTRGGHMTPHVCSERWLA